MSGEDPILQAVRNGLPLSDELVVDSHMHLGLYNQYYVPFSNHANAADELIKHMDRLGIDKGCIWSMGGQTADVVPLNDLIIDAVKRYPDRFIGYTFVNPNYPEVMIDELERCFKLSLRGIKLIPAYHAYPADGENLHIAYEFANEHSLPMHIHNLPEPEELVKDMLSKGVRAVRLFPNHYENPLIPEWSRHRRFYLSEWSVGTLFSVFEEHRIPVFLDFDTGEPYDDRTDWDKVYEICKNHPDMPVVLVRFGWRVNRSLYALLAQCDNFYWEFSGTWLYRIIEDVCKKFGPERTLFGSNMPFTTPAVNLMMVMYADISEEEKKLIAGDNLRRLLRNVT